MEITEIHTHFKGLNQVVCFYQYKKFLLWYLVEVQMIKTQIPTARETAFQFTYPTKSLQLEPLL